MSTEKKSKDVPVGRYRGDLYASLSHNPIARKPFRVLVWEWRGSFAYDATKEEQETCTWYSPSMFDDVKHEKDFRNVDAALRYMSKVRTMADRPYIMQQIREASDAGYERLV